MTATKDSKPSKPYPEFPLFAHQCGQWAKKIKGKIYYFGTWGDPDAALKLFLKEKDSLYGGLTPSRNGSVTVGNVLNSYLHHQKLRVESGDITQLTWDDYKTIGSVVQAELGKATDVSKLKPANFAAFRIKLGGKYSPSRLSKIVTVCRQAFTWAYESETIDALPRFGPDFKVASKKQHRKHRADSGKKLFSREEILSLLEAADAKWKAIILLCVNGGLGNTDIAELTFSHLDLDGGWIDYARRKTGIDRRIPLWLTTVEALRKAIEERPTPKPDAKELVFLTGHGRAMIRLTGKGTRTDQTVQNFRGLIKKAGLEGGGLYWLRHTFQTIGDEARDHPATTAIMGHADNSMAGNYRETISDERLRAVTDHVRGWLYSKTQDVV